MKKHKDVYTMSSGVLATILRAQNVENAKNSRSRHLNIDEVWEILRSEWAYGENLLTRPLNLMYNSIENYRKMDYEET